MAIVLRSTKGSALTHNELDGNFIDLQGQVNTKQATLVSGTNIKTINGNDITGSGNVVISGGGGGIDAPVTIPFTSSIPFNNICTAMQYTMTADTTFTVDTTNAQPGFGTILRLETGGNIPTFTGFRKIKGSQPISANSVNIIVFTFDGIEYNYSVLAYDIVLAWSSFIWQTVANGTRTGNSYTITNDPGWAVNPTLRLNSAQKGGFRWEVSDNSSVGLHNSGTDGVNLYVYGYYCAKQAGNAITVRENQNIVANVGIPVGTTHLAMFIDDFNTVTLESSIDNGDTFTVLHSFSIPSTTPGAYLYPFLNGGYNSIATTCDNPQIFNGVA